MSRGPTYPEPSSPYVTDEADILHDIRDLIADVIAPRLSNIHDLLAELAEQGKRGAENDRA